MQSKRMCTSEQGKHILLTGADSSTMLLWSILEKSRMSPRMVSSVSPLSKIVSASSLLNSNCSVKALAHSRQSSQEHSTGRHCAMHGSASSAWQCKALQSRAVDHLCSGLRLEDNSSCATAIMPLRGVRISWLMLARNMLLASAAVSAATCMSRDLITGCTLPS